MWPEEDCRRMISLHLVEGSDWSMAWKRSGPVWLVAGLVLVTALAVLDLALGTEVGLIGLLVAGSLVASMSAQPRGTAWVSLYGFALAIGLGASNDAWATADHASRCAGVFAGGGLSVWLAWLGLAASGVSRGWRFSVRSLRRCRRRRRWHRRGR